MGSQHFSPAGNRASSGVGSSSCSRQLYWNQEKTPVQLERPKKLEEE